MTDTMREASGDVILTHKSRKRIGRKHNIFLMAALRPKIGHWAELPALPGAAVRSASPTFLMSGTAERSHWMQSVAR